MHFRRREEPRCGQSRDAFARSDDEHPAIEPRAGLSLERLDEDPVRGADAPGRLDLESAGQEHLDVASESLSETDLHRPDLAVRWFPTRHGMPPCLDGST